MFHKKRTFYTRAVDLALKLQFKKWLKWCILSAFAQRNLEESLKFTSIGLKQTSKHLVKSSDYNSSMGTGAKKQPYENLFSNCIRLKTVWLNVSKQSIEELWANS